MYAQVVVLTYQPPDIPTYTYDVPKNLEDLIKIGQLVSVPFGKRNPIGVITGITPARGSAGVIPVEKLKPINSILLPQPILLPYQIELLKWMNFYYHAPMVNCLEAMIPKIPRRLSTGFIPTRGSAGINPASGQAIVLVPSISRIPETLAKFKSAKNYVVYHNELKVSQRFTAWQKILSGSVDYVFGARLAIFSPCPNLEEIIIYDEHEEGYHDERSPYYSTLTIAEKLQDLTGAKIKIIDSSPRITTYYTHRKEITEIIPVRGSTGVTPVEIVNMLDERKADNKSPLSQILSDYIKLGNARGKKILLFLNKKAESGHIYCRNCKYSDFALNLPDACPNCQSPDIWFSSTNVNSLAALVKKIIPSANVNIITKGSGMIPAGTIEIATAAVFFKLLTQKYDLVAHVQTDSITNIPDFTSAEKLFAQCQSLKKITRGLLLLQTYNPESPTINFAKTGNYQKFFASQLEERKTLSYPPFSLLVKLSIKGKKEENLEQKAQELYKKLKAGVTPARGTAGVTPVQILGPYKPIFPAKISKYNIILKIAVTNYSLKARETAMRKVENYLKIIPVGWQVEVEARSIND